MPPWTSAHIKTCLCRQAAPPDAPSPLNLRQLQPDCLQSPSRRGFILHPLLARVSVCSPRCAAVRDYRQRAAAGRAGGRMQRVCPGCMLSSTPPLRSVSLHWSKGELLDQRREGGAAEGRRAFLTDKKTSLLFFFNCFLFFLHLTFKN